MFKVTKRLLVKLTGKESGYTLVELMLAIFVLGIIATAAFGLFTALVNSALLMKRKSVALSLATSQIEYLKSLPYDALAVSGGSIVASSYLPATSLQTISGVKYTVTTSINYVDEAYDGCGSYPNLALKQKYCRNYPAPATAPATDTNPSDTKVAHVKVTDPGGTLLADVDTQVAARVAETASVTGAIFVTVVDGDGNPLEGANVHVTNSTTTPAVDVNDTTDQNGIAIFYNLPPDSTNYDYYATASLNGHSNLATIPPSGALQATYPNVQLLSQQSSSVTLQIRPIGTYSLLYETVDTSGDPLANVKLYVKGGYKKYTATTDTSYYFDNMSPSDSRVLTDSGGLGTSNSLVPGPYYICGDTGSTSCVVGSTTYYLAAAIPYTGDNALGPINVPTYVSSSPPTTTFLNNGNSYLQKVRLIMTTNSSWPRLSTLSPDEVSLSSPSASSFNFTITGANLPCNSSPASCSTTVRLKQASNTFTASCTGTAAGLILNCTIDLSSAVIGPTQLEVVSNGHTLTLPSGMNLGGINVAN